MAWAWERLVHQTSWHFISSVVSGPSNLVDFEFLQLARNLLIHAQMHKVFNRLKFSKISLNTSFFGRAIVRISFVTLASARDSEEGLTSMFLGH